jgi:hypothetical protein
VCESSAHTGTDLSHVARFGPPADPSADLFCTSALTIDYAEPQAQSRGTNQFGNDGQPSPALLEGLRLITEKEATVPFARPGVFIS